MASSSIRIELRGLADERQEAQRDLRRTLGTLEERLLPSRRVQRLVTHNDPKLVIVGLAATGLALGLFRDKSRVARTGALIAALAAGTVIFRLTRS